MIDVYVKQANEAYFFSILAYLDFNLFVKEENGKEVPVIQSLNDFIDKRNRYNSKNKIKDRFLSKETVSYEIKLGDIFKEGVEYKGKDCAELAPLINDILKTHSEYKDITIKNMSISTKSFSKGTLEAMTFEDGKSLYIAFRGTGAGKWMDNAEGLYKTSEMQKEAAKYALLMSKIYGKDKEIYFTGHSKGGNLAQAAALLSSAGKTVQRVFSFDGQGFSSDMVKSMEFPLKERYFDKIKAKIFQICDKNDFVNPLGIKVALDENTYYINGPKLSHPHSLVELSKNGYLNFEKDEKGIIKNGEQGEIGKFTRRLSDIIMGKDRQTVAQLSKGAMALATRFIKYKNPEESLIKEGTGRLKTASKEDLKALVNIGIPLIAKELNTKESENLMDEVRSYVPDLKSMESRTGKFVVNKVLNITDVKDVVKYVDAVASSKSLQAAVNGVLNILIKTKADLSEEITDDTLEKMESLIKMISPSIQEVPDKELDKDEKVVAYLEILDEIYEEKAAEQNRKSFFHKKEHIKEEDYLR